MHSTCTQYMYMYHLRQWSTRCFMIVDNKCQYLFAKWSQVFAGCQGKAISKETFSSLLYSFCLLFSFHVPQQTLGSLLSTLNVQSLPIFFSLLCFVLHRIPELHSFHLNSNTSENRQDRQASCGPRRKDAFDKRNCETKPCLCLVMCLLNTNTVIALLQSSKELCCVFVTLKIL